MTRANLVETLGYSVVFHLHTWVKPLASDNKACWVAKRAKVRFV